LDTGGAAIRRALILTAAGLILGLAIGHAPARAEAAACRAATNEASLLTKSQEARALLCVINKTRTRRDLHPVRPSAVLNVAALAHSVAMVAKRCFAHECKNELDLGGRLQKAGFPGCNCAWRASENIAYGENRLSSPRAVVTAWMNSPPHRRALLKPRFRLIGIGIVPGMPRAPLNVDAATFTIDLGWVGRPV
jgi:uncharacterized protein YkwD